MRVLGDVIRLAPSAEEFVRMVEEELETDSEEKRLRRIETARENSWDKRVEEMSRLIEGALAAKRRE